MVENKEQLFNPVQKIFRNPAYIGVRMLLAGIAVGGVVGCGSRGGEFGDNTFSAAQYRTSSPKIDSCPTTIAEVSLVAGGNPRNWKALEGLGNAWVFETQEGEVLTGAYKGRVDTEGSGPLLYGHRQFSVKKAWYVCSDALTTGSSEKLNSTPSVPGALPIPATPRP